MSSSKSVSFYFYNLLIKFYLPFEAKYVSLMGSKDYKLVTKLIEFYLEKIIPNHNIDIEENDFSSSYKKDLEKIFKESFMAYSKQLIEIIRKEKITLDESVKDRMMSNSKNEDFSLVIDELEEVLGINTEQKLEHNSLSCISKLHDTDIFKKEFEDIIHYMNLYIKMYQEVASIEDEKNEEYSELDYLKFVVCHEFLSALSHYSTAIVYFDSPKVFMNNLHRTITHLKRALMDIYDGLIMHYGCSKSLEYMQLRNKKVNSLGQNMKMKELIEALDTYYKSCKHKS